MSAEALIDDRGISVDIERPSFSADAGGTPATTWASHLSSINMFVQPVSGAEALRYGRMNESRFHLCYTKAGQDIRAGDRIILPVADTGFVLAGTGALVAGANPDWNNPSNITASDDTYAVTDALSSGTPTSDYIRATAFQFWTIPESAKIVGITVRSEEGHSQAQGTATHEDVQLWSGTALIGNDIAASEAWVGDNTADDTIDFGGASNLWGTSVTPADVKRSLFGVQMTATWASGATARPQIDSISMRISYRRVLQIQSVRTPGEFDATHTLSHLVVEAEEVN